MTQQQRDANKDLEFMDKVCSGFTFPIFEYWIQEAEKWRVEAFRKYPTPESYELACAAREKHRERADLAEQERDRLINLLDKIETALEYHEWTDYMQYVSDEITAYREGSNTDAKRD